MKEHTFQGSLNEVKALEEANKPYYRLFDGSSKGPVVVCLQPFDEADYDQSKFINGKHYETEDAAEEALLLLMRDRRMKLYEIVPKGTIAQFARDYKSKLASRIYKKTSDSDVPMDGEE